MVAQESNQNNTTATEAPAPARVTLTDLYRRAYNAAEDSDIESDGVISALLAVAAEIRLLRAALTGCTGDADRTGHGSRYRRTPTVPTLSYLREGEYDCL